MANIIIPKLNPLFRPGAINFTNNTDSYRRNEILEQTVDSQYWTVSFWIKRNTTFNSVDETIITNTGNRCQISIESSDNTIRFDGENSSGSNSINVQTAARIQDQNWHHILASFNKFDAENKRVYVDNKESLGSVIVYVVDSTIDFTRDNVLFGYRNGPTNNLRGSIAEFWMDTTIFVDFNNESQRRKFIDNGRPVYLGRNGERPFNKQPVIYCTNQYGADTWGDNRGYGGTFEEVGGSPTYEEGPLGQPIEPKSYYFVTLPSAASAQDIEGSLHTDTDIFFDGDFVTGVFNIDASLHQDPDTFFDADIATGVINLEGSLHQDADTFFDGRIANNIGGVLHQDADTFFDGDFAQLISGGLHQDTDTFFSGQLDLSIEGGSLFQDADTFFDSLVSPQNLFGSTLEDGDVFYGGFVGSNIEGSLHQDADTLFNGRLVKLISGSLHQDDDTLFQGHITHDIAGSLHQDADIFNQATVILGVGRQDIDGSLFNDGDNLFHGSITHLLFGSLLEDADTFFGGFVGSNIEGSLFEDADTFFSGVIGNSRIEGSLFQDTDILYHGKIVMITETLSRIIVIENPVGEADLIETFNEIVYASATDVIEGYDRFLHTT